MTDQRCCAGDNSNHISSWIVQNIIKNIHNPVFLGFFGSIGKLTEDTVHNWCIVYRFFKIRVKRFQYITLKQQLLLAFSPRKLSMLQIPEVDKCLLDLQDRLCVSRLIPTLLKPT